MKKLLSIVALSLSLLALSSFYSFAQGTWHQLTNTAPDQNGGVCFLLSDGTVMCLTGYDTTCPCNSGYGNRWDLLTPDNTGSYLNGTWSQLPAMNYSRLYCSTEIFPDGNVLVAGGEYGTGDSTGEYFNTVTHTWTKASGVPNTGNWLDGPGYWAIHDGNSEILYDGTVLQGVQVSNSLNSIDNLIYHEGSNMYDSAAESFGSHDEASWVKLPDSSIMNVDIGSTNSERYIPKLGHWVVDATLPNYIYDRSLYESGPAILLPNGNVVFLSDSIYSAIYTPSGNSSPGTWAQGPAMPSVNGFGQLGCPDAPAAMMPNGNILCDFSHAATYDDTCWFYEFNYLTNTFTPINNPFGPGDLDGVGSYTTNMLDLPDGSVLLSMQGNSTYYQYVPTGSPLAAGQPTIDTIIDVCPSFQITGKLFNGISEGQGYGDDWQMATNFPIVRLTNGLNTYYARTTNWNRIGAVMTGSLEDTAYFTVPAGLIPGIYSVVVIANGNPSAPYVITLPCTLTGEQQTTVENHSMTVYPNPNKGVFTIQSSVVSGQSSVEVYNILGEQVYSHYQIIKLSNYQIDLSAQPSGLYFYRVLGEAGNLLGKGKMVIQK